MDLEMDYEFLASVAFPSSLHWKEERPEINAKIGSQTTKCLLTTSIPLNVCSAFASAQLPLLSILLLVSE